MTAANEQDRAQITELAELAQAETGETVEIAYLDQSYTGEIAADAAEGHEIKLKIVNCEANNGKEKRMSRTAPDTNLGHASG